MGHTVTTTQQGTKLVNMVHYGTCDENKAEARRRYGDSIVKMSYVGSDTWVIEIRS